MTTAIPLTSHERLVWVVGQLKLRGESFASIASRVGRSRTGVRQAMMMPSAQMEQAIAETLDLKVHVLFPERYDASGRRLHQTRGAAA